MPTADTPWPTLEQYTLAHRCPTCRAAPGVRCTAPRKAARKARLVGYARQAGHPDDVIAREHGLTDLHVTRQSRGVQHFNGDKARAPWPENRVPGQRYDTVPDEILRATP